MPFLRLGLLAVCTLVAASWSFARPAQAEEVIRSFVADVAVRRDGSVRVRETITVKVEQKIIRRGIFRDLPVAFRDDRGDALEAEYTVTSVTRNGEPEPFVTERAGDMMRIRIGRPDDILDRMTHVYVIEYETGRQVGFYGTYDEIYWNVTGDGWALPIERAEVRLRPPPGTSGFDRLRSYTGPRGSSSADTRRRESLDGSMVVTTTRTLIPGEGFTVAGIWPKGYVTPPSRAEQLLDRVSLAGAAPAAVGYVGLLAYFIIMWWQKGRDPKKGPLVPRYYPPVGLGPSAQRYVRNMGFDDKTLTVAILSMAVKRYLIINEQGPNEYFLERTFRKNVRLTKAERVVADALYKDGPARFDVSRINHTRLTQAKQDLEKVLKGDYERAYFSLNTMTVIFGAVIGAALMLWLAFTDDQAVPTMFLSVWLSFWGFGLYQMVVRTKLVWQTAHRRMGLGTIIKALFSSVPLLIMSFGLLVGLGLLISVASPVIAGLAALIVATCLAFYHWMKVPTRVGRRLMDEIEGFRHYLKLAEEDRMNFHNAPDETPELFEAYLPYALALDVEHDWAEIFEEQLSEATRVESGGVAPYRPVWYYAGGTRPFHAGQFSDLLASQFSSNLTRASSPPQRSGGSAFSSGGGFSGGGGGGGGGGGW